MIDETKGEALVQRLLELQDLLESKDQGHRYFARQELAARLPDIIAAIGMETRRAETTGSAAKP